jgi:hypothetical protein
MPANGVCFEACSMPQVHAGQSNPAPIGNLDLTSCGTAKAVL